MEQIQSEMNENGFAIIENFLTEDDINILKCAGKEFTHNAVKEKNRVIFNTAEKIQERNQYFLNSSDKISYFFEKEALNECGALLIDVELSLNKVGHALHWLHPGFKKITFDNKVKQICRKLQLEQPVIVQSMFIYKNPGIGSEVGIHQDSSYLYTEPVTLYGFWIALDDATEENGCLWFIPGSHKNGVYERVIRNPDSKSAELLINIGNKVEFEDCLFVPAPVKKGSCVLIHGNIIHRSYHNKSMKQRNAYTFHIVDISKSHYPKDNWLQANFPLVYEN